jgi:membrane protein
VNINIILILLGNELNIAIKKVRVEKMIADEIYTNSLQITKEQMEINDDLEDHHHITVQ